MITMDITLWLIMAKGYCYIGLTKKYTITSITSSNVPQDTVVLTHLFYHHSLWDFCNTPYASKFSIMA